MNNPDAMPVDVAAERAWLREHKENAGLSWPTISKQSGIPSGTLSGWILPTYPGNAESVARKVFKYRQMIETQAAHAASSRATAIDAPDYIPMPTAEMVGRLLVVAHSGEITVGAMGSGTGKTKAAEQYAASASNVWLVTIEPALNTLGAMISEVARVVGAKTGWQRQMSAAVRTQVCGRQGLLIFDEANNLDFKMLEQIRAWADKGVGVCLLGNEELLATIRKGNGRYNSHAFARLSSRIALSHVQDYPLDGDIEMYLDARGIQQPEQRSFLKKEAIRPGAGGLREIHHIIKNAGFLASDDEVDLSFEHLREAKAARSTTHLRTMR